MTSHVDDAVAYLRSRIGGDIDLAIVLGTGLGGFAEAVTDPVEVPYADIPGFPLGNVTGHAHRVVAGVLEGRRILVLQGRSHYYETGDPAIMRTPIETLKRLGVSTLLLTNAAGSLKRDIQPGQLCLISDHINMSGTNPLIGDRGDGRFVPMNDAYSPRLRNRMKRAAMSAGVRVHEGVYCWMSGPSFETPAEIKMIRSLGADLVGMSTVPETILARRFGMDVIAVSIVTNFGAGLEMATAPSHEETKQVASTGGIALRRLLNAFLKGLDDVT
jgi:purine-nucleoside phosphorylase